MSDEKTTSGASAFSDGAEIGRHLSNIVQKMVNEHMAWVTGFGNWANQMMMNMQIVPPQAYADLENRQRWMREYLAQFEPVAALLKKSGDEGFAARLAQYQEGFGKLDAMYSETSAAISAENAETQRKIMKIQSEMAAENSKAFADRLALQKKTAAYVQEKTADGIAAQQESNRRMNESVRRGLFGL